MDDPTSEDPDWDATREMRQKLLGVVCGGGRVSVKVALSALVQTIAGVMAQLPPELVANLLPTMADTVKAYEVLARQHPEEYDRQPRPTVSGACGHG